MKTWEKIRVPDDIWTHKPPWSSECSNSWATGQRLYDGEGLAGTASCGHTAKYWLGTYELVTGSWSHIVCEKPYSEGEPFSAKWRIPRAKRVEFANEASGKRCQDLSNIFLKAVISHRFNQSDLDTRSWYHGTAALIECLQAPMPTLSSPDCSRLAPLLLDHT